ncbi:glucose-6-phosphate isomerase [Microgenomates group bacterium]|nr:glucose-6-phosphate isomerase [Microgenomates group bacterium]
MIKLNTTFAFNNLTEAEYEKLLDTAMENVKKLNKGEGDNEDKGVKMIGWQEWANKISKSELEEIETAAAKLRECEVVWCIGIGGSYLGVVAMMEGIFGPYYNQTTNGERPQFYFLGADTDSDHLLQVKELSRGKKLGLIAISKSGTTIEPAMALRFGLQMLEEMKLSPTDHLIAITDGKKGALHDLANKLGASRLVVPDDIGGRFSVMTPVGLLPMAVAGIDIEAYLMGIREMMAVADSEQKEENLAAQLAAWRVGMMRLYKNVEYQVTDNRSFLGNLGWLQQLEAESEGHEEKGVHIIPSLFTRDLHSFGQLIQDGQRGCYEVATKIAPERTGIKVPALPKEHDLDGLEKIAAEGPTFDAINGSVIEAALSAHYASGVSAIIIELPPLSAYVLGEYHYLLMKATAISGYMLGVNPFTQPGVQAWKDQLTGRLK